MKYTLITLLVISNAIGVSAQTHYLYGDAGYTPGFSVTYNYKLAKWFGAGIGVQGYQFYRNYVNEKKFTPALFADVRLSIRPEKNNQFFSFLGFGMNFYKVDKSYHRDTTGISHISHNNGFYFGLGLGYFRRMTKRGGGPYASFKMITNWYNVNKYSIVSEKGDMRPTEIYGGLAFSLGFKF